jgi:hypothetical protein
MASYRPREERMAPIRPGSMAPSTTFKGSRGRCDGTGVSVDEQCQFGILHLKATTREIRVAAAAAAASMQR